MRCHCGHVHLKTVANFRAGSCFTSTSWSVEQAALTVGPTVIWWLSVDLCFIYVIFGGHLVV